MRRFILILAGIVCLASAAFAHTFLERSWPRDNSHLNLSQAPTQLRILFTERVEPTLARISLADAAGREVVLGRASLVADNRRILVIPIETALGAGAYTTSWRVVSSDGHVSEGQFHFTVVQ